MAAFTAARALSLLAKHGAMLQSARGPLPSLVDAIAGEPVKGSWWGHEKGKLIYAVLTGVLDSELVAACRLYEGKVTLIHISIWPALFKAVPERRGPGLDRVRQEHTASGAHQAWTEEWPGWLPLEARADAARLTEAKARALLGPLETMVSAEAER